MKVKINFDPNAIKQFFIDHVEKILFGIVVVLFLLFVYKAVARDTLAWQPQDLINEAKQASDKILDTKPASPPIVDYTKEVERIRKPIVAADYSLKADWDPQMFNEQDRRGSPVLFPVKDLHAAGGNGAFAMASPDEEEDESGNPVGTMRGMRWVVVTGLIPLRKQKEAYDAAYQEAAQWNPGRDYPDYVYYHVERAEVDPRAETPELKWTPLRLVDMMYLQEFFLQSGGEVVDPAYLVQSGRGVPMAFPLGPLQNRPWGPEVAHVPEIPLAEHGSPLMGGGEMGSMPGMYGGMMGRRPKVARGGTGGAAAAADSDDDEKKLLADRKARAERRKKAREKLLAQQPDTPDTFDAGAAGAGGMGPGGMGYGYGARGAMGRRGMSGSMPGSMPDSMAGSMPGSMPGMSSGMMPGRMASSRMPGMGGMPRGVRGRIATGDQPEEAEEPEMEFKLFRFFDFSAKPGEHYRYRVKLVLANPNFGMSPHYLEKDGMEKEKWLQTGWSEPSPAVSVPPDSQVLAVSAKASNGTASLLLVHFDAKDGSTAAEEFPNKDFPLLQRGQLLNYRGRKFAEAGVGAAPGMPGMGSMPGSMPGMSGSMPGSMPGMPGMSGYGPRGRASADEDETADQRKVDYLTNCLLLDMTGGSPLPGRDRSLVEPGSILLLNDEGKLVVHNELDDLADYHFYKPPERREPAKLAGAKKSKKGKGGYSSPYGSSSSMEDMMSVYGQGTGKGKKGKKGKKGSASMMPPGMTPGMMPGMGSSMPGMGGVGDLDDGSARRRKRSR